MFDEYHTILCRKVEKISIKHCFKYYAKNIIKKRFEKRFLKGDIKCESFSCVRMCSNVPHLNRESPVTPWRLPL